MGNSRKVLLVGWDAADWKVIHPLLDVGQMPNVERLVDAGASGQIATLHPPYSPMLWTSIATGKRPFQHDVLGFSEPTPDGRGVRPITNLSRKVKALWNILTQRDLSSIVVGWWPSFPAEPINGVMVSNHFQQAHGPLEKGWPLAPGNVHPPELHERLAEMRFHPNEAPGELLDFFIPRAREIDQDKDRRLAGCNKTLCECVSIHSAATWLVENQEWDFAAIYYDAIDHFSHGFMKYHPPRQERIKEEDFALYSGVIDAAYKFHDQMLGALLKQTGPDTTVILMSDHGFHPDHLRPKGIPLEPAGPAAEHRDFGILALAGPNIKHDHLLHGASILDVAPTVLTVFGLPVGEDMDGSVVVDAFVEPPEIAVIPSWEEVVGNDGRHPPDTQVDPVAAKESLDQLVALGYIEKPDEDHAKAVANTVAELQFNLAMAYQDADRYAESLEILRSLHEQDVNEQRFQVRRFMACQALGRIDEMGEIVADLDGRRRQLYDEAVEKVREFRKLARERAKERKQQAGEAPATAEAQQAQEHEADAELQGALSPAGRAEDGGQQPAGVVASKPMPLLTDDERKEFTHWERLTRFDPPAVDYLKAQLAAMQGRPEEALRLLERVSSKQLLRPGLYLQTAEMFCLLRRWKVAKETYHKALEVDRDNAHAHLGLGRIAQRRRRYEEAAQHALDALQRMYHYPLAHYQLGQALCALGQTDRAIEALRTALSFNPNFLQARRRLRLLLRKLGHDEELANERQLDSARSTTPRQSCGLTGRADSQPLALPGDREYDQTLPPLGDDVVVVSGLPRSGTSMLMQMLAAGGLPLMTDELRAADEDNPRGYYEYEPVKRMEAGADWMHQVRGKAVKIVAPLLRFLPPDESYRIIFVERNLDEVLDSQARMLERGGLTPQESALRRARLRTEFARQLAALRVLFSKWRTGRVLYVSYAAAVRRSAVGAGRINAFLGGKLDADAMAAAVDGALHRNRAISSAE